MQNPFKYDVFVFDVNNDILDYMSCVNGVDVDAYLQSGMVSRGNGVIVIDKETYGKFSLNVIQNDIAPTLTQSALFKGFPQIFYYL